MRLLYFVSAMLCCATCFSQTRVMDDSTSKVAIRVFRGETLSIAYDTGYILNKNYFGLIKRNIDHAINANEFSIQLKKAYEANIDELRRELDRKEVYYQKLKTNYDHLDSATTTMVVQTNRKLDDIGISLANARTDLDTVRSSLQLSLKDLNKQQKQQWKFALGGFGIGVVVTTVVFLLVK